MRDQNTNGSTITVLLRGYDVRGSEESTDAVQVEIGLLKLTWIRDWSRTDSGTASSDMMQEEMGNTGNPGLKIWMKDEGCPATTDGFS